MTRLTTGALTLLCGLTLQVARPLRVEGQENLLANPARWTISDDGGAFAREGGESVLRLTGGQATLHDLTFSDGRIEFDMRLDGRPGFVGMEFRAGEGVGEHVYFRPHKSTEWDAIQYEPIMHGSTTWQIHSGPGFSQAVTLPAAQWIPVRIDVRGDEADLFVGGVSTPTMHMVLERGVTSGAILFAAYYRDEGPAGGVPGAFRRLRIAPWPPAPAHPHPAAPRNDGFIRTWSVSDPLALDATPVRAVPAVPGTRHTIEAEARGLVNLNRAFSRVQGATQSAVVAEVTLNATAATVVPLALDFSDDVSVFLNEDLVFTGTNGWESRYPYYLGVLNPNTLSNTVWLPLAAGRNRLRLVVSEQAFGWGFVAKLGRVAGLTVSAP